MCVTLPLSVYAEMSWEEKEKEKERSEFLMLSTVHVRYKLCCPHVYSTWPSRGQMSPCIEFLLTQFVLLQSIHVMRLLYVIRNLLCTDSVRDNPCFIWCHSCFVGGMQ